MEELDTSGRRLYPAHTINRPSRQTPSFGRDTFLRFQIGDQFLEVLPCLERGQIRVAMQQIRPKAPVLDRHGELHHRRIGVDTGAYATSALTAVKLEGRGQFLLQTIRTRDNSFRVVKKVLERPPER